MKTFDIYDGGSVGVIALGRFDGLHKGHIAVLAAAKAVARELGEELTLFTFKRDLGEKNLILSFDETLIKAEEAGVDNVVYASESKEFFSLKKDGFLNLLFEKLKPKAVVCGKDYTFGFNKEGNAEILKNYCLKKGVIIKVADILTFNGQKISSSDIRAALNSGDMVRANGLLGYEYFISGVVEHGRKAGAKLGFPTANITPSAVKAPIKEGVYISGVEVEGKTYTALTSYGVAPTFGKNELKCESYICGFDGDLYGKKIKVNFKRFLRENFKFSSKEELIIQIQKDLSELK